MRKCSYIILLLVIFTSAAFKSNGAIDLTANEYLLTIYAYESLLADPGYNFVQGYSNYSGIPVDSIHLILVDDANTIVTQAVLEKNNPIADVLIGIDNVLIHTAKQEEILEPYASSSLVNISQNLIDNLDPDMYLLPYDYGIIALWYDTSRINSSSISNINNLTLDDILSLGLDSKLIVEDPTLSSPGLGFLLWTIAVYGDPEIEFEGLLGRDWRDWWNNATDNLRITSSWGAAFDLFYSDEENRPIMVSYGTSPAYDVCHPLWGVGTEVDPPSAVFLSHENGLDNAWLQIEGIGLVKDAPNKENAKNFIDWFLSEELQQNIPLNNWMYPANNQTEIDSCFLDSAINPNEVDILNYLISPTMLSNNLDRWKSEWEIEIVEFSSIIVVISTISFASISYIFLKRRH
ncbi:MAG: thiamine ABC transporter substrate-binding protein [Candidatus Heimdallarchaeota archaeon]|nr:thiamine ABC transporter substrate-binding protein [Candidatus Heimdallarchaeota archaeon]